jgi:hypothetical protein
VLCVSNCVCLHGGLYWLVLVAKNKMSRLPNQYKMVGLQPSSTLVGNRVGMVPGQGIWFTSFGVLAREL